MFTSSVPQYDGKWFNGSYDRDLLSAELQQGRMRGEIMDAVEKAIIKEQPRLDYFAKDDNPDRHTAACMKCLRDRTAPFFAKKRENQNG